MSTTLIRFNGVSPKEHGETGPIYARLQKRTQHAAAFVRDRTIIVLKDLIETLGVFGKIFEESTGDVKKGLTYGTVFFLMWCFIYLSSFCIREESFVRGVEAAYQHSWLSPSSANSTQIHSQAALEASMQSDFVTRRILTEVLHEAPASSRARLALIHDGIATITGVDLLRFDITQSVAAPGHTPGSVFVNEPLADWTPDLLPALSKHECALSEVANMENLARKQRLEEMGATWVMGCPVIDVYDRIFGAILVTWDVGAVPPQGAALTQLFEKVKSDGQRLGAALDMSSAHN
jgi:hypothetical protein